MSKTVNQPTSGALPERILLEKWFDVGFFWQGELAVASLSRLSAQVNMALQTQHQPNLSVVCHLSKKNERLVYLSFDVAGDVWLDCHRCLQPMSVSLTDSYHLAVVKDEKDLSLVGDDPYVLLDDLGADVRYLPIQNLLEDELLLALPIAVHHDDCDMPMTFEFCDDDERESPLAVLASLKGKLS